ncbi:MAG: Hsp20 family protein [Candidatus Babeliales bacterium]
MLKQSLSVFAFLFLAPSVTCAHDFDSFNTRCMRIHHEIEDLMKDLFTQPKADNAPYIRLDDATLSLSIKAPDIDHEKIDIKKVLEQKEEYVRITVPGAHGFLEIVVTPFTIAYERKHEQKEEKTEDGKQVASYYSYGSSVVRQALPAEIQFEDIKAEYEHDTLTITFQKAEPKKIEQRIAVVKK